MNIPSNFTKVIDLVSLTTVANIVTDTHTVVNLKKQSLPVQGGELGFTNSATFVSKFDESADGGTVTVAIQGCMNADFADIDTFTLVTLAAQSADGTVIGTYAGPLPPFIRARVTAASTPNGTLSVKAIVGGR
jgi:hypothetical protein